MPGVVPSPVVDEKLCPLGNMTERGDIDPAWRIEWLISFLRRMHISIRDTIDNLKVGVGGCTDFCKTVDIADNHRTSSQWNFPYRLLK